MSRAGTGVAAVSGFPAVPSRPVTSVQARARVAEGEGYLDVLAVTAGPGYRPSRFRRARSRRPRRGWPVGMGPVGPVPGRPPRPQPSSGQAGRGPLPAGLGSGCWNRVRGAGYLDALVTGGEVDEQAAGAAHVFALEDRDAGRDVDQHHRAARAGLHRPEGNDPALPKPIAPFGLTRQLGPRWRAAANPGRCGGEGVAMTLVCPAGGPGVPGSAAAPGWLESGLLVKRRVVRRPPAG